MLTPLNPFFFLPDRACSDGAARRDNCKGTGMKYKTGSEPVNGEHHEAIYLTGDAENPAC